MPKGMKIKVAMRKKFCEINNVQFYSYNSESICYNAESNFKFTAKQNNGFNNCLKYISFIKYSL